MASHKRRLPAGYSDMLLERPAPSGNSTVVSSFHKRLTINILYSFRDVAWRRFHIMRKLLAKLSLYAVKDFHFMGVRSPEMIEKYGPTLSLYASTHNRPAPCIVERHHSQFTEQRQKKIDEEIKLVWQRRSISPLKLRLHMAKEPQKKNG